MADEKIGGYRIVFHKGAEERIALRPKTRYRRVGLGIYELGYSEWQCCTYEAFINPSTTDAANPGGLIAGARAMKTLTFWLSWGRIDKAAKAWADP